MLSCFHRTLERVGQTDRKTNWP